MRVQALTKPTMNKKPKAEKIRVLWYSDFLRPTGFGNVAEEIMSRLLKTGKYEFEVVAINHYGAPYNKSNNPYYKFKDVPVHPANSIKPNDALGYFKLADLLSENKYDLFFALQDSFNLVPMKGAILEAKKKNDFRYIFYFPVDGDLHKEWVNEAVQVADYPVTYSKFGLNKVHEIQPSINLDYIYHGADLETFRPFDSEDERDVFRKEYFASPQSRNEFIITNVNRNQPRKDLPRFIDAFNLFCSKYPEVPARMYLHCNASDIAGHDLYEYFSQYVDKEHESRIIVPTPQAFKNDGYPVEVVRKIYAASDVVSSTTLGEGWGLSTTEAMACGTPVVMPDNSATTEIIGENEERGYLVRSGGSPNLYITKKNDNEIKRPLTDIEHLVEQWKHVYDNREEAKAKAVVARKWLEEYTWDIIAEKWDGIFQKAYNSLK